MVLKKNIKGSPPKTPKTPKKKVAFDIDLPHLRVKLLTDESKFPEGERRSQPGVVDLTQIFTNETIFNITPMNIAATFIYYFTHGLSIANLESFLNPGVISFTLIKSESLRIINISNDALRREQKSFAKANAVLKEQGKEVQKWPKEKNFLQPVPSFCVTRVGRIVKIGLLSMDNTKWGEKCLTYVGNESLTEWSLKSIESYGSEDFSSTSFIPLEIQAWDFAKWVLKKDVLDKGTLSTPNKSTQIIAGTDGKLLRLSYRGGSDVQCVDRELPFDVIHALGA